MSAALADADEVVTKGAFAALLNVTAGRVSQYIAEGKIHGPALVGEGRNAKIAVRTAKAQLRGGLDVGQRLGNGIDTRLEDEPPLTAAAVEEPSNVRQFRPAPEDAVAEAIKREKLRAAQMANETAAEARLAKRGTYVLAADVTAAMTSALAGMINVFEGSLSDLASTIAAKFELPQRDVLHLLRSQFAAIRAKAADDARRRAATMPAFVQDEIADEETSPEG